MIEEKNKFSDVINLITLNEDGNIEISIEGINFLSSLKSKKIAILSITGLLNSGKTSLANSLLNKSNAFPKNTKGLEIYTHPIELTNGKQLLVIDTQGLNKIDSDSASQKLFILTILLSTCVIYNCKKDINEEEINTISYYTNLVNKINIYPENETNNNNNNANNNSINSLKDYFPQFILICNKPNNQDDNNDSNKYLKEIISNNSKLDIYNKLFVNKSCFFISKNNNEEENANNILNSEDLFTKIKNEINHKKINNFDLDGDSLFGILQNYLDSLNNNEKPIISSALENVLLSKGKNISENVCELFKNELNSQLEKKYPFDINDIYKRFFEVQDKSVIKFCEGVEETLTPKQTGDYLIKLFERMHNELEGILDNNRDSYYKLYDKEYKEIEKNLNNSNYNLNNKLDDIKQIFNDYSNEIKNCLGKFINIPNCDSFKSLILVLQKIFEDHIGSKLKKYGEEINEIYQKLVNENKKSNEEYEKNLKRLNEHIENNTKLLQDKNKEKNELNRTYLELESKFEKLSRDSKMKEKEYENNINIEKQKFQKMESYYLNQIKDKDNLKSQLEIKLEKLNKEFAENSKVSLNKNDEINKESLKSQDEDDKLKEKEGENKINNDNDVNNNNKISSNDNNKNLNLQNLFKNIQNTFLDFKESVDKLDRENENIFKTKYLELLSKEIDNKLSNWIGEIKLFREDQIKTMNDTYKQNLLKKQDEIGELKFEITKINCELNEQTLSIETYKKQLVDYTKEKEEIEKNSKSKDSLIQTQQEAIKIFDDKIKELNKVKEDLEINLNKNIVNYKMKEDELDTLLMVIDGMLSRKKDKYEHNLSRLSAETKTAIESLVKSYKLFR